jgi:cytochrome d ubiquinol oxidase subunit II
MELDFALISVAVIGFGLIMYVILDGFDLGVGILFPFAGNEQVRDSMINSIAPVWDGNETWLVMGGAILFAGFPKAYAIVLPALYIPIMLMLFSLIFRGVAFEFRMKANESKFLWTAVFFAASFMAAFSQGLLLAGLITGINVENGEFAGGPFDWASPFALVVGLAMVCGYALLGATWLIRKTEGELLAMSFRGSKVFLITIMIFMAIVSLYTPRLVPEIAEKWFSGENIFYLLPAPIIGLICAWRLWYDLRAKREDSPFFWAIGLFLTGYVGLGVSFWPYIIPFEVTIWDAASPASSQLFLLIPILFIMPITLAYSWYSYRVFRGKVTDVSGYSAHK